MIRKFSWQRPEKSARLFFVLLVSLGMFSVGVILSLAMYGLGKTISRQIYLDAQDQGMHIGMAIRNLEKSAFIKEGSKGEWEVRMDEADMSVFDAKMQDFLELFEIAKIKIYDTKRRVVYSTDASIIGREDSGNLLLAKALTGVADSVLKSKDSPLDLGGGEKLRVDVVETYVPISSDENKVIGAFEIYKDITRDRQTIASLIRKNVAILSIVLFLVFAPSMLVVWKLTRRLALTHSELKQQASVDSLTGLLTRSEVLAQTSERIFCPSRRQKDMTGHTGSVGIIMLDIDHFKKINDTYGHLAGDLVLKAVAQRIVSVLRQEDIVGRYGGEEFLVVLPESSLETARYLGERIRHVIAEHPFPCQGTSLPVTVSAGVSFCASGDERGFDVALQEADKALYLAKDGGRNQVCHLPEATWRHASGKAVCTPADSG